MLAFSGAARETASLRYNTQVSKKGKKCATRVHIAINAASFPQSERACIAGLRTAPMQPYAQSAEDRFPLNLVKSLR